MPDTDFCPTGLADLIADAIEAIGLEDVVLVGNDTGGGLCQVLVTRRPERIGRLVLMSSDAYEMALPLRLMLLAFSPARIPALARILFAAIRLLALRRPFLAPVMHAQHLAPEVSDSYTLPVDQPRDRVGREAAPRGARFHGAA